MTKAELIKNLEGMNDSHEVRISLSGDSYTFAIVSIQQSNMVTLTEYIQISVDNHND